MTAKREASVMRDGLEAKHRLERITGLTDLYAQPLTLGWMVSGIRPDGTRLGAVGRSIGIACQRFLSENLREIKEQLIQEQGERCAACGKLEPVELDHIEARSHGRNDRRENCQLLCRPCHEAKTGRLAFSRRLTQTGAGQQSEQ